MAAVSMKPVDRLPFWPKIFDIYVKSQSAPFCDMSLNDVHNYIGSDKHAKVGACYKIVRKNVSVEVIKDNNTNTTVYKTPVGSTTAIDKYTASSDSWHPVKHPIETLEDLKIMTVFFTNSKTEIDYDKLELARQRYKEIGDDAITSTNIGTSALMEFVERLAGVENANYLLADYPDEVSELFEEIHKDILRRAEISAENSPADIINIMENTSTTLISPTQYRTYCFDHINQYGSIVKQAGKPFMIHMCGHLKDLLPDLSKLNASAFEAFTSPTLGNTTLLDGRTGCPDKCLIGGTNAILWTQDSDTIIKKIEENLDALPHHRGIVVTSAGVMPPFAKPETIKTVCDWVKSYKIRM
ncbi:MAG: methylcobalamin:coenzyme M methyltransferase [Firmicutes bacterium ADurb.Bin193]|nr:MAG: methylcobalamin:coenzyme M methyltransferase [Firmicutes bacterium ADurb.Bin193]